MINHETLEQIITVAIPTAFVGGLVVGNIMDYLVARYSTLRSLGRERAEDFASEQLKKWEKSNPLIKVGTYGRKIAYEQTLR